MVRCLMVNVKRFSVHRPSGAQWTARNGATRSASISTRSSHTHSNSRLSGPFGRLDMWGTCKYVCRMSKMIQLRNVPESLHRKLKARAAQAGMSLSDYLIAEIRRSAERPTAEEFQARLATRTPAVLPIDPADAVRAERDSR